MKMTSPRVSWLPATEFWLTFFFGNKSLENEEMIVAVNAIYTIAWRSLKKYSGLQRGLNPVT